MDGYIGVFLGDYVAIRIPKELASEMDKFVGKFGYRSRAEIAKEGIRRLLLLISPSSLQEPILEVLPQIES